MSGWNHLTDYLGSVARKHNSRLALVKARQTFKDQRQQEQLEKVLDYNLNPKLCMQCNTPIGYEKRINKFCNRSCSTRFNNVNRVYSTVTANKISISLTGIHNPRKGSGKQLEEKICIACYSTYFTKRNNQKFCSKLCYLTSDIGKNMMSVVARTKMANRPMRSKNEILFGELCSNHFDNVIYNTPMFNGWDADVIVTDLKVAVLWNGKWHYEKLTQKHSVKQVQNRDKIKVMEIENCGYIPYVIKDMGSYNKQKVNEEFSKFIQWIGEMVIT